MWKCERCGCEAVIPLDVPADAEVICPVCHPGTAGEIVEQVQQPPAPARRTKVAIVGFADSWPAAPWHHPEWEVWCLNQFYDLVGAGPNLAGGKVDFAKLASEGRLRWFEIHSRHDLETDPNVIGRHAHHVQRLREMPCPVYMQQHHEDIPNSVEYPLQTMLDRFGRYFTNSVSYMLALAISEGATEIGLYGVNMAQDSEWARERPSCEYFVGWARGAGIQVHIPLQSDLLKAPYLYGYEDDRASAFVAKLQELRREHLGKLEHHQQVRDQNEAFAQQFHGAIQQIDGIMKIATIGR